MKVLSLICLLAIVSIAAADNLPDKFFGSFEHDRSENFDEYMEEMGYGWFTRKLVRLASVTKVFTKTGTNTFNFDNLTTKKNLKYRDITLGKEFIGESLDGSDHKITFYMKGNTLYEKHIPTDSDATQKADEYRFHFDGEELVQTLEYNGVVAKRYFERV